MTMTTPSEITAKFLEAYDAFIIIEGQPTDSDVNRVFDALSRILYPIEYNETDAVQNLICIIQDDNPYTTKHGWDWKDHVQKLLLTLNKLKRKGLKCNIENYFFRQTEMKYLVFWVTRDGFKPILKIKTQ